MSDDSSDNDELFKESDEDELNIEEFK